MTNPIQIKNFQTGMANSPYVGFGKLVGMDIFRKPGIIQAGTRLDLSTSLTPTSLITAEIYDQYGNYYIGCNDGKFYKNYILIATCLTAIHDMVIFADTSTQKDYLLISQSGNHISSYGALDDISPIFIETWIGGLNVSTNGYKKMVVGQDNVIYIGNENKLASIVGFSYGTPAINLSCLSTGVPNNRIIQSICELNRYLVISTSVGSGSTGNTRMYFMDRGILDGSGTGFYLSIGVEIPERKVNQLITKDNKLYFFGCDTGTVYTSNTVSWSEVCVIPMRLQAQNYITYPNAVAILNKEILWGIGGVYNSAYDTIYGVYSLQQNSFMIKNTLSSGEYGQTTNVSIGSVNSQQNGIYNVGWQTGTTTFGLDTAVSNIGDKYKCWFESPFYETGQADTPRSFQKILFNFGNNLVDNQSLRVSYRNATNKAWSTPKIYAFSQYGAVNSFHGIFPTEPTTNLQLKVEFDTDQTSGNSLYGNNIELQSIILE